MFADTHLPSPDLGRLPAGAVRAVEQADLLLHAGDVVSPGALDALRQIVPVHAVLGNNDRELIGVLPDSLVLDLAGVTVAILHDSGRREGRAARLHRRFPSSAVVVFGHSHVPVDEAGLSGQVLFNPRLAHPAPVPTALFLRGPRARGRPGAPATGRAGVSRGREVSYEWAERP